VPPYCGIVPAEVVVGMVVGTVVGVVEVVVGVVDGFVVGDVVAVCCPQEVRSSKNTIMKLVTRNMTFAFIFPSFSYFYSMCSILSRFY
jgi:hypothetical protein